MKTMTNRLTLGTLVLAVSGLAGLGAAAHPAPAGDGKMVELPRQDRKTLDDLLGRGVLGKSVPAPVIDDPGAFIGLTEGQWRFRLTSGKQRGSYRNQSLKPLQDPGTWRYQADEKHIDFIRTESDGTVSLVSEQDLDHGVVSRYSPCEPLLIAGLEPGSTRQMAINVKVYDLSHPDHLKYDGKLDLTYSYLGACEINTPDGRFEASIIKWHYHGKVGPASVDDVQYRAFVRDVGLVGVVDKTHISAMLIYSDRSKEGQVAAQGQAAAAR